MVKPIDFKLHFIEDEKLAYYIPSGMTHQQSICKIITPKYETEVNKQEYHKLKHMFFSLLFKYLAFLVISVFFSKMISALFQKQQPCPAM